ncbi:MAG TPA: hypothetical protein VD761_02210 [Solirubrobacterales bacterium]|nr:hypothetical protein [Solirubrobacterales bacterium]
MAKPPAKRVKKDEAERSGEEPIDFLGSRPSASVESVRQLIEAENVLASYSHAMDLLAEAVQNALDAIDTRSELEPDAPRKLVIDFDVQRRRFVVVDTGTGLSRADLDIVLTPSVTLKQGGLRRPRIGRSRGEKGVGLTFLVLASDSFLIKTSDGEETWEVRVKDAGRWVRTEGGVATPKGLPKPLPETELLGSDRYTVVSVGGIDNDQFDDDLFDRTPEQLVWDLRTRTAVGNTAFLFKRVGRDRPKDVEVTLRFHDAEGKDHDPIQVDYGYATPEDLLRMHDPDAEVLEFDSVRRLPPEDLARQARGSAMRYVRRMSTASRGPVDLYLFTMDGNEMNSRLEALESEGKWVPDEWQGIFVAARDMPTGVRLPEGSIGQRTYERRIFALLQYDGLKLDLGRKTLSGRTPKMLSGLVNEAWTKDLKYLVPRLSEAVSLPKVNTAALKAKIRRARKLPDLDSDLPYLKQPDKPAGVVALFHEMIARNGVVPRLRTVTSGVFRPTDSLVYLPENDPDKDDPSHILFAMRPSELIEELEGNDRTRTVTLGILWTLEDGEAADTKITAEQIESGEDGATHELRLGGLAKRNALRVIVLDSLLSD